MSTPTSAAGRSGPVQDTRHRPPTGHDVARAAGVSQSTVSHVMTGKPGISEETRQRVLDAAHVLGYRPNLAARSMRTRQTGRLAVIMPITSYNPAVLLAGALRVAEEAGFALEVYSVAGDDEARDDRIRALLDSGQFEGVLALSAMAEREPNPRWPALVSLGEFDDQMHVSGPLSDATPLVSLIETLVAHGHRRFLHVAGDLQFRSARARRDAYETTIGRLGVASVGVVGGEWSGTAGYEAILALPEGSPPLAVIAANDLIAAGVLRGAAERGWRVPMDLVVTGWDDYEVSQFLVPPLTTIRIDFELLGARATHRLIAMVRGTESEQPSGDVQTIIWRDSTNRG